MAFVPVFKKTGELLLNSDFAQGLTNWTFQYYSGAASSSALVSGGIEINNTTLGTNIWNIQLIQTNLALYSGKTYELSFDYVADRNMAISGGVGMNGGAYTNYLGISELATTTSVSYKQRFKMKVDDLAARLAFDLGTNLGKVKITNISLVEIVATGIENENVSNRKAVYLNTEKELVFEQASSIENVKVYNYLGQVFYQGAAVSNFKLNQNALVLVTYKDGRTEIVKLNSTNY
jgi:hypothetical protein